MFIFSFGSFGELFIFRGFWGFGSSLRFCLFEGLGRFGLFFLFV